MKSFIALAVALPLLAVAAPITGQESPGAVEGTVLLNGPAPRNRLIPMGADPNCLMINAGKKVRHEHVLADAEGRLANVLVRLEGSAAPQPAPAPGAALVIEQQGCMYRPRVAAARVGQMLRIVNRDDTLHNVHSQSDQGTDFNVSQPLAGMEHEIELKNPEIVLHLRCEVHPWMESYVAVLEHSWFAVTGADGAFSLENVPPGSHTVVTWHERFGEARQVVQVSSGETTRVELSYSPETAQANSSLPVREVVLDKERAGTER